MKQINSTSVEALPKADRWIAGGLVAGFLLLYLLTQLQVHSELSDAMAFASYIERGRLSELFHGSHLIYLWLMNLLHQLALLVVPGIESNITTQGFDSLIGALGVGTFYLIGRSFMRNQRLTILLSVIMGCSYHYWLYASDVETWGPAILFSLLTLLTVLRLPPKPSIWHFVLLAILTALTILFHIVGGMVGLVVIAMLLWDDVPERLSVRIAPRRLGELALYFVVTAGFVIVPYILVITQVRHMRTASEAFYFVAQFAESGAFETTGSRGVLTAIKLAPIGIGRAYIGQLSWFGVPGLNGILTELLAGKCLFEEFYAIRTLSPALATVLTGAGVMASVLLGILTIISIPGLVRAVRGLPRAARGILLWLILYGLFILWFESSNPEHWAAFWLPVFYLAVGLGLDHMESRSSLSEVLAVLMTACLLATNLGNILIQTDPANDIFRQRLSWYQENTTSQDLLIASGGFGWTDYVRYYLTTPALMLDTVFAGRDYPAACQVIQNAIEATRGQGGRVFVMQDALEPEPCRAEQFGWDLSLFERFRQDITPRLDCSEHEGILICEVVR